MKTIFGMLAVAALAIGVPASAQTVTHTFNTTGSDPDNGTYGNSLTRTAAAPTGSTLQVKITGWQSRQSTDDITKAYVGAYATGLGVTGYGDNGGDDGYHQIDNVGNYTDFILLQFSRAVTLSSVVLNSYQLGNQRTNDSDMAFWNAGSIVTPLWNSAVDLTAYDTNPALWTEKAGSGGLNVSVPLTASGASSKWLVSASFISKNNERDDGFKIASISVTETIAAVPEPSTWAMMLVGFGAAGFAMRRGQRGGKTSVNFAKAA